MATDPNFNLRTHERLFTGPNKNTDEGLRAAAWKATPKCSTCGSAVMFEGNKAKHYDGRWDSGLSTMNIQDKQDIQLSGKRTDADHPATVTEMPKSSAPDLPTRAQGAGIVAKPNKATAGTRAAVTRGRNRAAANKRTNMLLGRQWNPTAYDENGIAISASDRFN